MNHSVPIRLHVFGEFACFTRPEMKVERVSYDVITPSAARGILEAIYWKPQIRWQIDELHVLAPIRFTSQRRNEIAKKISIQDAKQAMKSSKGKLGIYADEGANRQQRAATLLRDVEYGIVAHLELLDASEPVAKHFEMFKRRASKGQCFHHPYLGCREFPASFAWLEGPVPNSPLKGTQELGFMLHDIDYNKMSPRFFRATMVDGVIAVPSLDSEEIRS